MMKKMTKSFLKTGLLTLFVTAPGISNRKMEAPFAFRNFAHRGLHTNPALREEGKEYLAENSLAAFERACEEGYGMELDVQLSKDGQVVVFHDDTLNRVCGVDARVDSKTLGELKRLRLENTEATIPLFTEVLDTVAGRQPLIVELKTTKRREELCRKTWDILKEYKGAYCIESFDPFIVTWFRIHAPKVLRGQLACHLETKEGDPWTKKVLYFMGENCLFNFLARPQFIAYEIGKRPWSVDLAYLLGAMKVGWTSRKEGMEEGYDAVIFEYYHPATRYR